jgi:hypothetical protein
MELEVFANTLLFAGQPLLPKHLFRMVVEYLFPAFVFPGRIHPKQPVPYDEPLFRDMVQLWATGKAYNRRFLTTQDGTVDGFNAFHSQAVRDRVAHDFKQRENTEMSRRCFENIVFKCFEPHLSTVILHDAPEIYIDNVHHPNAPVHVENFRSLYRFSARDDEVKPETATPFTSRIMELEAILDKYDEDDGDVTNEQCKAWMEEQASLREQSRLWLLHHGDGIIQTTRIAHRIHVKCPRDMTGWSARTLLTAMDAHMPRSHGYRIDPDSVRVVGINLADMLPVVECRMPFVSHAHGPGHLSFWD